MKTLGALIFMISIAMGTVPPKEGDFPEGVLENLRSQGIGESYGDPGWMKKIASLKRQKIQEIFNLNLIFQFYLESILVLQLILMNQRLMIYYLVIIQQGL